MSQHEVNDTKPPVVNVPKEPHDPKQPQPHKDTPPHKDPHPPQK